MAENDPKMENEEGHVSEKDEEKKKEKKDKKKKEEGEGGENGEKEGKKKDKGKKKKTKEETKQKLKDKYTGNPDQLKMKLEKVEGKIEALLEEKAEIMRMMKEAEEQNQGQTE